MTTEKKSHPRAKRRLKTEKEALVELHVRLPMVLFNKVAHQRDVLLKKDPMANISDAARALLEAAPDPR